MYQSQQTISAFVKKKVEKKSCVSSFLICWKVIGQEKKKHIHNVDAIQESKYGNILDEFSFRLVNNVLFSRSMGW